MCATDWLERRAVLHRQDIRVVRLTGDNRTTAEAVARKLGIEEVQAEILPDQKGRRGREAAPGRQGGGNGR